MNDPRAVARAAVARVSTVIEALGEGTQHRNAGLDVRAPLVAAFDLLIDELEALKREISALRAPR